MTKRKSVGRVVVRKLVKLTAVALLAYVPSWLGVVAAQEPPKSDTSEQAPAAGGTPPAGVPAAPTIAPSSFAPPAAPVHDVVVVPVEGVPAAPASPAAESPAAPVSAVEAAPAEAAKKTARVRGRVLDQQSNTPLFEITVQVVGTAYQTTSSELGEFELALPPGEYQLELGSEYYVKKSLQVKLQDAQTLTLERPIVLALNVPVEKLETERTVIREPDRNSSEAQLQVRKNSMRVSDVVSAEEIKKSADSSASQAAARVVGATIVGDRFVYVRGLGERYSNALFNGAPLPSPEPDQKAVPFDIFPASLLANLTIAKSATPDIPGDFAGGSVQINTQDFPSKRLLNLSASVGGNLQTVFQPMLTYRGGALDFLGIDDGTRALPTHKGGQSATDFARSFPNIWMPRRAELGSPNYSFSAVLGDQVHVKEAKVGYLLSLLYSADTQTREEEVQVLNLVDGGSGPQLRSLVQFGNAGGDFSQKRGPYSVRTTYSTQWGSLATVSVQPSLLHRISLVGLFTQNGDREARIYQGYSQEQFSEVWNSRLRFIARSMGFAQLSGTHRFERASSSALGAGDLDWSLTYAAAARAEPDNRELTYIRKDDGLLHFTPKGTSGQRFYSDNIEHQASAIVDYTQAFKQWSQLPARFKVGASARLRLRSFSAQRYKFGFGGLGDIDDTQSAESIFAPENVGTKLDVRENTNSADHYSARMGVYSGYAMLDLPLHAKLRMTVGLRLEASQQRLNSLDPRQSDLPVEIALNNYDPLPSLNLLLRATESMNLRASVSMTVARPEFRELAPFQFADFFGGEVLQGNPQLQRTRIVNTDLRWEWFLGASDLLAISAFYKYFDAPIETTINAGGDLIRSFANARAAATVGAELEAHKELLFAGHGLRGLAVGGNLSLVYSRVDLSGVVGQQTSKERALQGQSPYVLNAFVELDRPDWGLQVRALYNVFGERIDQVGAFGLPDKYEQPRHQLDLTISQRLRGGWSLRLSGKNLVNSPVHIVQRGVVGSGALAQEVEATTLRYSLGQSVMLSLTYKN